MYPLRWKAPLLIILGVAAAGSLFIQARREESQQRDLQRTIQSLQARNQRLAADAKRSPPIPSTRAAEVGNAAGLVREMAARKVRDGAATASPAALQPTLKPISSLSFVGQATPLAAVDSSLWAIYHGDIDQLAKLIALTTAGKDAAEALFATLPPEAQAQVQSPERMTALLIAFGYNAVGYQILDAHPNDADPSTWTVQAVVQLEDGRTVRPNTPLRETNGNWQVEFDQNAVKQFSVFLTSAVGPASAAH